MSNQDNAFCIEDFKVTEVLDYYDFPRLFSLIDTYGNYWLGINIAETETEDWYLYCRLSHENMSDLLNDRLPVRDCIFSADKFLLVKDIFEREIKTVSPLEREGIQDEWLPKPGIFLKKADYFPICPLKI